MNVLPSVEQPRARAWAGPCAIALGCVALMGRTTSFLSLAPTIAIGVLGIGGAVRHKAPRASVIRIAGVTLLGIAALVVVRMLHTPIHSRIPVEVVLVSVVAAVAEEAFFRRYVYAWIADQGEGLAIVVAAALFAVIHVPIYGAGVLPIDFAAGLLLGWQRRESGTWISPAITHVIANIIQMR
jgi:membrane protease YdiL (CAAX protease family)